MDTMTRQPPRVGIVKHDYLIVSGQPQVAFDAAAELDRGELVIARATTEHHTPVDAGRGPVGRSF